MMEKWFVIQKRADFQEIARKFGIHPVTARLIRNREVVSDEAIYKYLKGSIAELYDPHMLKDADKLVDILQKKITDGAKIRIIGDYDIDGVMSTYILYRCIKRCGGNVTTQIPDRIRDGYGINIHLIEEAYQAGVDTIITCDNGIAAIDEIAMAKKLGITVLVTDHHEIPYEEIRKTVTAINGAAADYEESACAEMSKTGTIVNGVKTVVERCYKKSLADAIVNPKQPDCSYPFKGLCGAAVAFKVMQILYEKMGITEEIWEFLENVAFATVGDVMDLVDENRILVREGLKRIRKTENPGMRALILQNQLEMERISVYHIGFILGPCVNASGRLETARESLQLFLQENDENAAKIAKKLVELNAQRKDMTAEGVEEAKRFVEKGDAGEKVLVIFLPEVHESLAGIIAGRIREQYHKPTFVLTRSEEGVKGSGRSVEEYSMYEELCRCQELFTKFGGHPMAAGISLAEKNVDLFREKINDTCTMQEEDFIPRVKIDIAMPLDYPEAGLVRELELLEPFGKGNVKPQFADRNLQVERAAVAGRNMNVLKLNLLTEHGNRVSAVYFGDIAAWKTYYTEKFGQQALEAAFRGEKNEIRMAVVYYPEINTYQGIESVQAIIRNYK